MPLKIERMTAHDLICEDGDRKFSVGRSKIVWDGIYVTPLQNYRAYRVVSRYNSLGHCLASEYLSRIISPNTVINQKK